MKEEKENLIQEFEIKKKDLEGNFFKYLLVSFIYSLSGNNDICLLFFFSSSLSIPCS